MVAAVFLATALAASAQHGTVQRGTEDPLPFTGDTWAGQVQATNPDTREVTLTAETHGQSESFIGVLEKGYKVKLVDGTEHEVQLSELSPGTQLTVYYYPKTKKVNGKKLKINQIFRIDRK
jgi:hypothetical protein